MWAPHCGMSRRTHQHHHVSCVRFHCHSSFASESVESISKTVAVDSSGTRLFSGHVDGSIHSYDVNSGQRLSTLVAAVSPSAGAAPLISCLQTHESSGYLLALSRDGLIAMFELRGGRVVHVSFTSDISFVLKMITIFANTETQRQWIQNNSRLFQGIIDKTTPLISINTFCLN